MAVSIGEALQKASERLSWAGVPEARKEARSLLAHVLEVDWAVLITDPGKPVADAPLSRFQELVSRRMTGEPAQYITGYEAKYGKDSRTTFGGHAYDTFALLSKAVPEALKKAKPGTKEFRAALRDALEVSNVVGTHGVFVMSPQDHNGLDNRARVMIKIENGKWVLVK